MSVPAAQTPPRSNTPTQDNLTAPSTDKRPSSTRLPSLNQIAAGLKLDPSTAPSPAASAAARPRLAASLLRTASTASLVSTAASASDSVAVQAPTSRSTSPSSLSTPPPSEPPAAGDSEEAAGGEALTTDHLQKLNEQTATPPASTSSTASSSKMPRGYKGIPGLDALAARHLAKARTLSIDGSARPPDAELVEDPKTPGLKVKPREHPLENRWTIYHDQKSGFPPASAGGEQQPPSAHPGFGPGSVEKGEYEAGLTVIGENIDTVEMFCRYFNWLKPPSKLEKNSNYHLFKANIKPMWEDPANANGGKWVLTMKNNPQLLDRCWSWLAMALVGEELDEGDEICGAVVSLRSKVDRIQVWTRGKEDVEKLNGIAKKLVKILDISEGDHIGLEFQYNSEDRPNHNKFISIQSIPQTSYRPSFRNSPVAGPGEGPQVGGAFGSFSVGGGGALGRGTWKRG
ncbi:translation initiation factor eIF4e [Punctularia strigosozonata HHB-11173 SS5]|uniref:translation initiation factor eIF4e n=1 Tax=Punctularia strigosozonata (strain HHB-11173) TaxID=741275 RepID=UPI0004417F14|nr:translation initiation factor eIF4e [Punctularia strigosozonata HHB-11173 SS5]EIN08991.1 translation initiation factor eIF4e [Punctularia strigosozonata HHB-11173 SS5]